MSEDQFETFWKAYPRRIGKGAARKSFARAIKLTTLGTMLAAISEYVSRKPERIDFKHPATWLNQECWSDEWPAEDKSFQRKRTIADAARDRISDSSNDQWFRRVEH